MLVLTRSSSFIFSLARERKKEEPNLGVLKNYKCPELPSEKCKCTMINVQYKTSFPIVKILKNSSLDFALCLRLKIGMSPLSFFHRKG